MPAKFVILKNDEDMFFWRLLDNRGDKIVTSDAPVHTEKEAREQISRVKRSANNFTKVETRK